MTASITRPLALALAAALTLTAGCATGAATTGDAADDMLRAGGARWNARMISRTNPPVGGIASVAPSSTNGRSIAYVSLEGSPSAARAYAWRVFDAPCDSRGTIIGTAVDYPYIVMRADGTGEGSATLPSNRFRSASSVRVYASTSSAVVVACGDLRQSQ